MIAFSAHFDGELIVPEHAVDLPRDHPFLVHVDTSCSPDPAGANPPLNALQWLADNSVEDDLSSDLSAQHDHYLYGTPKEPDSEQALFCGYRFWIALFRSRDQYHADALRWQAYLVRSGAMIVTTEAVCWEWLNAMSGAATRNAAASGFDRVRHDPQIEVISCNPELNSEAIRLFTARSEKNWSLTDCLSFMVMGRRNMRDALTADNHFEQAGFRAVLSDIPPSS